MATNCPQHVKPRACRSAYVRFTSAWNSVRGNRLRSWLNMLENRVTGEPPWWWRVEACRPRHHHTPRGLTRSQTLIWTRVIFDIEDGEAMRGKTPEHAEELIMKQGRRGLTEVEVISLGLHTNVLFRHY